ncbi:MAG: hypothetical protein C4297_11745 [Gemmataceae bacterium]
MRPAIRAMQTLAAAAIRPYDTFLPCAMGECPVCGASVPPDGVLSIFHSLDRFARAVSIHRVFDLDAHYLTGAHWLVGLAQVFQALLVFRSGCFRQILVLMSKGAFLQPSLRVWPGLGAHGNHLAPEAELAHFGRSRHVAGVRAYFPL